MSEREEKPLHIRVAEALGWRECEKDSRANGGVGNGWEGVSPEPGSCGVCYQPRHRSRIPAFDTDWAATGPLIDKFEISMCPAKFAQIGEHEGWIVVTSHGGIPIEALGETPLLAICNLILKLKEVGRL